MKKPFFIIGMPLAGKSYLVNKLRDQLNIQAADTDHLILEYYNKTRQNLNSVSEIYEQLGIKEFRKLERIVLKNLNKDIKLISCGGGLPCYYNNIEFICNQGTVIYLSKSVEELLKKNKQYKHPVYKSLSKEGFHSLLSRRAYFYNKAHHTFNYSGAFNFLYKQFLICEEI